MIMSIKRSLLDPTMKFSEDEVEQMLKRYQETGDTGITPMRDIIKAYKENPNIIISYEGDIPFSEYCKRLRNGGYDE